MLEWLKRLIAGNELDELERWRLHWWETRRWLSEFPDSADALDYLRNSVKGVREFDVARLRENMRKRRAEDDAFAAQLAAIEESAKSGARLTEHRFKL